MYTEHRARKLHNLQINVVYESFFLRLSNEYIGTDILINCDFISLVYQKKSYLYIFFLPLLNKSFIISYIICRDYIVQKRQLADDLFVALK